MPISEKKNHTCDNNCRACDEILTCDHADFEQLDFSFDYDVDAINWNDVAEYDVAPEASKEDFETSSNKITSNLTKIDIEERREALVDKRSARVMNEFLKKYASKLLKYSIISIIGLYIIDLLVTFFGKSNSKFADPLFTLLQTIITTVIGYLIGSNQNKD